MGSGGFSLLEGSLSLAFQSPNRPHTRFAPHVRSSQKTSGFGRPSLTAIFAVLARFNSTFWMVGSGHSSSKVSLVLNERRRSSISSRLAALS